MPFSEARFDRFARPVSHLLRARVEFSHLGIDFVSLSESIDTSTPMGKMIFIVLGAVAELERNLIKERAQMGISRARKQGKRLGRPKRIFDKEKARGSFGVPPEYDMGAVTAIGYLGDPTSLPEQYRTGEVAPRTRKPVREFVFSGWEKPATF